MKFDAQPADPLIPKNVLKPEATAILDCNECFTGIPCTNWRFKQCIGIVTKQIALRLIYGI